MCGPRTGKESPNPGLGRMCEGGHLEAEAQVPTAHHPVRGPGGQPQLLPVHTHGRCQAVPQFTLELYSVAGLP